MSDFTRLPAKVTRRSFVTLVSAAALSPRWVEGEVFERPVVAHEFEFHVDGFEPILFLTYKNRPGRLYASWMGQAMWIKEYPETLPWKARREAGWRVFTLKWEGKQAEVCARTTSPDTVDIDHLWMAEIKD